MIMMADVILIMLVGKVKVGDREYTFPEYPPFITELIKTGGLMNLIKEGKFQ